MDGENNGKPYFLMDDLEGKTHYFRKPPHPSREKTGQKHSPLSTASFAGVSTVEPKMLMRAESQGLVEEG